MKRRTRKHRRNELSGDELMELMIGPAGATSSAFESPFARRDAWLEHCDDLMGETNAGTRPWGWWEFEAPEPRRVCSTRVLSEPTTGQPATIVSGDGFVSRVRHDGVVEDRETREQYLLRLGLLSKSERALRAWARQEQRREAAR